MALFSRKIECLNCGKNFKAKRESKRVVYCCSTYDNLGREHCERNAISEEDIVELVNKRFDRELSIEEIEEVVEHIEIQNRWQFKIRIKNDIPIIFGDNFIQF